MPLREQYGVDSQGKAVRYQWNEPEKNGSLPSMAFHASDPTLTASEVSAYAARMGQLTSRAVNWFRVLVLLIFILCAIYIQQVDVVIWVIVGAIVQVVMSVVPVGVEMWYQEHGFGLVKTRYSGTTQQVQDTIHKPTPQQGLAFSADTPVAGSAIPTVVLTEMDVMEAMLRYAVKRAYIVSTAEPRKKPWPIVSVRKGTEIIMSRQMTPLWWRRCALILERAGVLTQVTERSKREVIPETEADAKKLLENYLPHVRSMTDGDWAKIDQLAKAQGGNDGQNEAGSGGNDR